MMYEITIPVIGPGRTETLDPLVADALIGGEQSCTVSAKSDNVVFNREDGQSTKTVQVVEPKLKLTLNGPDQRYTNTVADYELIVANPGTAPARKVRIQATLPVNGRLIKNSKLGAAYDPSTRRLQWMIDQIDSSSTPQKFTFQVRMGGTGTYEVFAEAVGEGGVKDKQLRHTEVVGMPDVNLVVSEKKRVVDVGGETTFFITLRNYGTKDAAHLAVIAALSPNLKYIDAGTRAADVKIRGTERETPSRSRSPSWARQGDGPGSVSTGDERRSEAGEVQGRGHSRRPAGALRRHGLDQGHLVPRNAAGNK